MKKRPKPHKPVRSLSLRTYPIRRLALSLQEVCIVKAFWHRGDMSTNDIARRMFIPEHIVDSIVHEA